MIRMMTAMISSKIPASEFQETIAGISPTIIRGSSEYAARNHIRNRGRGEPRRRRRDGFCLQHNW
jgi:hypothetical protein